MSRRLTWSLILTLMMVHGATPVYAEPPETQTADVERANERPNIVSPETGRDIIPGPPREFPVRRQQGAQATSGARAFNPAISVIPDVNAYGGDQQGLAYALMRQADGFAVPGADEPTTFDPERGFNLRELEVAFSGAVDPYFEVWATVIANRDGLTVEEAYVQTRQLLPGVRLRFGRFLTGFGYINKQHPHQWDFFDQALPYEAILGGAIADIGIQTTWLPALPFYLELGFEALQGENARVANRMVDEFPDLFEDTPGPRMFTTFAKVAPSLGYSNELQLGVSYSYSRDHHEAVQTEGVLNGGMSGPAWIVGTDVVWRYDSGKEYGRGDWTVQGEYLFRQKDLSLIASDGVPVLGGATTTHRQDGVYGQVVYGFAPRWTTAARFDAIGLTNTVTTRAGVSSFDISRRASANVTFNPTEFSRVRFQYNRSQIQQRGELEDIHQAMVQFQMSLGAHGAHQF